MKRVFELGQTYANSSEEPRFRPLDTSIQIDGKGSFWIVLGAAEMTPNAAEEVARKLLLAANKARAMNLAGSVTV